LFDLDYAELPQRKEAKQPVDELVGLGPIIESVERRPAGEAFPSADAEFIDRVFHPKKPPHQSKPSVIGAPIKEYAMLWVPIFGVPCRTRSLPILIISNARKISCGASSFMVSTPQIGRA
jgi:hypothetical protein